MKSSESKILYRKQIDRQIQTLKKADLSRPRNGWIRAIRTALGMSGRQLADRLGLRTNATASLEKRERTGAITVRHLEKAAGALGCRLVYAFVPLEGTLEETVQRRARFIAGRTIEPVGHSMALESQSVDTRFTKSQVEALAGRLARNLPRSLWDEPR